MQIDPEKALSTLHKVGPEWAKAKGARVYLEESLRSVKAELMSKSGEQVIAAQERHAYAHPEYRAAVQALADAVEIEEGLRRRLITAEAAIEIWRSLNASNRRMDRAAA